MSNDERLRLLLIEQEGYENNHRTTGITHGAAAVFAKWPSYIASAIWCTVFIILLVTLIMLIAFMSLIKQGKMVEQNHYSTNEEGSPRIVKDIKSEFCEQMTTKTHEKRQSIPEKDLEMFDSGNNIFYMVMKPLDQYSACSIESVLKLSPLKNVFLMFLSNVQKLYEYALMLKYKNFNIINVDGKSITRGSPFEGKWIGDDMSVFEVALLTVWQFGGTVLSEDLLMLNNKLYEKESIHCQIDPELIYCPNQCASYLYDLIGETLKFDHNQSMDNLIDNSIMRFCGSEHFIHTGCTGISRVDKMEMCGSPDKKCMFVRTREWMTTENNKTSTIWPDMGKYCPATYKYQNTLDRRDHDHKSKFGVTSSENFTQTQEKHKSTKDSNMKTREQSTSIQHQKVSVSYPNSTIKIS